MDTSVRQMLRLVALVYQDPVPTGSLHDHLCLQLGQPPATVDRMLADAEASGLLRKTHHRWEIAPKALLLAQRIDTHLQSSQRRRRPRYRPYSDYVPRRWPSAQTSSNN